MIIFDKGLRDGMIKSAEMSEKTRRRLRMAAFGAGAAGLAAGAMALSRPGIRADFAASLRGLGRGGAVSVERSSKIPAAAAAQAKAVAKALKDSGIDPSKARIAISGTGGTGKSTLARGLSEQLGMKVRFLDDHGSSMTGRDYVSYLRKNPVRAGYIAEQTHLLNQVDPDKFDVIIRVHKPMDKVKKQILKRGRGAYQLDLYDYDRLNNTISTAFESAGGKKISPVSGVDIKIRPRDGFKSNSQLRDMIRKRGMTVPVNATREQLVHMAATGDSPMLRGIVPFLRKKDLAIGAGLSTAAGAAGAYGAGVTQGRQSSGLKSNRS